MENGTKRWAIVNDGVVVNIVAADEAFANAQGYVFVSDKDILDPDDAEICIGRLWDGAKFSPPPRN